MVLLISLSSVGETTAGIYKWTDENGNVHFGDKPVDASSATELKIDTSKKSGITNSSGNKSEREYLLKKIEEEKQEQAEAKSKRLAQKKERRAKCNALKSNYQAHIQSNRSYRMSPDGERTYLSDAERTARNNNLKKAISKHCR
jgi:hypothetical protein